MINFKFNLPHEKYLNLHYEAHLIFSRLTLTSSYLDHYFPIQEQDDLYDFQSSGRSSKLHGLWKGLRVNPNDLL